MIKVPENIKTLSSYEPGKTVAELVEENKWDNYAVLWNNENSLGSSPKAMEAVKNELTKSNFYPDPKGRKLCSLLAKKVGKKTENIVLGNGSEALLLNIIRAFCDDGNEVLTSEGTFMIIYNWAKINNVICRAVPLTDDYKFDLDGIIKSINRDTKVIYLSNINNPTGTMITERELDNFLNKVPEEVLVIVDEAYFEFSSFLNDDYPDSTKFDRDNVITVRTLSKAYGIAGIRLGYAIAPKELIESLYKVRLTFEPSNLTQAAGIGAIDDDKFLTQTLKNNKKGLQDYYTCFDQLGITFVPSGGNFVMIDLESPEQAKQVYEGLFNKGVLVRLLGGPLSHCIRITVGSQKENELCIAGLQAMYS
ncbi:MAG: histidinol-phosphate transaminase [Cyclobacteriaceae bacterium]